MSKKVKAYINDIIVKSKQWDRDALTL